MPPRRWAPIPGGRSSSVIYPAARSGIVTGLLLARGAHQRRDRAAAVHRAQQPVLEQQPQRADGEPAGGHLPVRAQSLPNWQQLAWSGALIITVSILVLSIAARLVVSSLRQAGGADAHPAGASCGAARRRDRRRPARSSSRCGTSNFYYGAAQALKDINLTLSDRRSPPSSVPPAAASRRCCGCSTACTRCIRAIAPSGDVLLDGAGHPRPDGRRRRAALPRRHGVPEAHAFPDVDLRQRGLRPAPVAAHRAQRARATRVEEALRDAAMWDEVKDKLHEDGRGLSGGQQQRLCIARTIALQPGGDPVRRADRGARPDLDPARRGDAAEPAREVLHRHRHAQPAAGRARLERHRLHVPGRAGGDRTDRADVHRAEESPHRRLRHRDGSAEAGRAT